MLSVQAGVWSADSACSETNVALAQQKRRAAHVARTHEHLTISWLLKRNAGHGRALKDPSGTVHHVIFALVAAYVLYNSIFKFPFAWLSLCEASTPFVNYRRAQRFDSLGTSVSLAGREQWLSRLGILNQHRHPVCCLSESSHTAAARRLYMVRTPKRSACALNCQR